MLIANRYVLEDEIGQGGMGTVYKGVDIRTDNLVAIKLLNSDILDQAPDTLERFRREGQALRDLNHPNIVKMLDTVEEQGKNYLILEYISGGDLTDVLETEELSIKRVLNIAIDLADALTRAHRIGIIHRDLKPANILLAQDGTIRLTDFGLARITSEAPVTNPDNVIGTLDYIPPEALQNQGIDSRADIWAFGIILFEMLYGKRPFIGQDVGATLRAILYDALPDLETLRPDISIELVDLVYRMLEKDPQTRISSVRHIGAILEDILQGRDSDTITVATVRPAMPTPTAVELSKYNLPEQTTAFVGREAEIAELTRLLDQSDIRLVTILGPGGMGKTRLALEVASRYAGLGTVNGNTPISQHLEFLDGVYIVELAPLSDPATIITTIGEAIHYQFQEDGRDQSQQLLDYLGNKQLLLIMDNYEHLMDGTNHVTDLLKGTSHVKIIATSRQRLNQTGETVFNLEGMDFPQWETPEDALEFAAVKLFMQSAKRARPDFELGMDDLPFVARISRLVLGMPLGILLSASWLAMLTPEEIADEIQQGMDFLESDMSDLPDRHRSIRAVFDYSWNLMTDNERAVFAKLSIFRGGFTREAAQQVANANLRTLMTLMNKSLIRRDANNGRYEVHELLRQYGHEQLVESGTQDETSTAYSKHYSELLAKLENKLKGHGQVPALSKIDLDFENVRLAWTSAISKGDGHTINTMLEALYWYCTFRSRFLEGLELFRQARQKFHANSDQADLVAGRLSTHFPESTDDPLPIYERALAIARHHNDKLEEAWCLRLIGYHLSHGNIDPHKGNRIFEESIMAFQALGDEYTAAVVMDDLSWGYSMIGDFPNRLKYAQRSVNLRKTIGDEIGTANALRNLGGALFTNGDTVKAEQAWQEGLTMAIRLGDRANVAWCKVLLVSARVGEYPLPNDPLLSEAEKTATDVGIRKLVILINLLRGLLTALHGDYQQGYDIIDKIYPQKQEDRLLAVFGAWGYCIAAVGLKEYMLLRQFIMRGFELAPRKRTIAPGLFAPSVILLIHDKNFEFAAELAGFITVALVSLRWSEKWQPYIQAKADLKQELGEEAYNAAFERGKQREIEQTANEIVDRIRR
jgi:predicted ATPase